MAGTSKPDVSINAEACEWCRFYCFVPRDTEASTALSSSSTFTLATAIVLSHL